MLSGKVKDVSKVAGEYHYYTLGMQMKDKMVSCPVMNAEGQVFGIAQKSSGIDTVTTCYAAGAAFAMSQKISALSLGDAALKKHWHPERPARNGRSGISVLVYGIFEPVGRRLRKAVG